PEGAVPGAGLGKGLPAPAREPGSAAPPLIVSAGGDGTVSCVASNLQGTKTALGVLPMGTLNHFARDVGIPAELDAAIEIIAPGHTIAVDVGAVNEIHFINNASLGLYPDIVRD